MAVRCRLCVMVSLIDGWRRARTGEVVVDEALSTKAVRGRNATTAGEVEGGKSEGESGGKSTVKQSFSRYRINVRFAVRCCVQRAAD